jgi:hypothetical protein
MLGKTWKEVDNTEDELCVVIRCPENIGTNFPYLQEEKNSF